MNPPNTFDERELQNLLEEYNHPVLSQLLKTYLKAGKDNLIELQIESDTLTWKGMQVGFSNIDIERFDKRNDQQFFKLLSLNVGGFGVDSNAFDDLDRGTQENILLPKLKKYIASHDFDIVHFQDFPLEKKYIRELCMEGAYNYVFVPHIFLKHRFHGSQDSGLLVLSKKKISLGNFRLLFHQTGIPKVNHYQSHFQASDMLLFNSTLFYDIECGKKRITMANTYISPISRKKERLESIVSSTMRHDTHNSFLMTGDMNIYGSNTLNSGFGLSAIPYGFLKNAVSALLTHKNIPHYLERAQLSRLLKKSHYRIANLDGTYQSTINIKLSDYAPNFFNFLLNKIEARWLLDLAITDIDCLVTRIEPEPFGDIDHSSLIVNWRV